MIGLGRDDFGYGIAEVHILTRVSPPHSSFSILCLCTLLFVHKRKNTHTNLDSTILLAATSNLVMVLSSENLHVKCGVEPWLEVPFLGFEQWLKLPIYVDLSHGLNPLKMDLWAMAQIIRKFYAFFKMFRHHITEEAGVINWSKFWSACV